MILVIEFDLKEGLGRGQRPRRSELEYGQVEKV
jgi:hypothetical protein